jgi:hypothetical protein
MIKNATAAKPAKKTVRFFAPHDDALRNGSFSKVNYYPADRRGVVHLVNGDFWNADDLKTTQECEVASQNFLKDGYREYTKAEVKAACPSLWN